MRKQRFGRQRQSVPAKKNSQLDQSFCAKGAYRAGTTPGRFIAALLALFLSACLVSRTSAEERPSQFVIGIESEPERLDPLTIKNPKTFILSWQIYEGLLGLGEDGKIEPVLAERWETKDFRTWIFHIRKNVAFHASSLFGAQTKSRVVTAQDVLWSYTAFCSSGAYSSFLLTDSVEGCADYNTGKATSVAGLKVLDEHTLQINAASM